MNKTPISTSLYKTIVMHKAGNNTYGNRGLVHGRSWFDRQPPQCARSWKCWSKYRSYFNVPYKRRTYRFVLVQVFDIRLCTDLMKCVLLSTLADNHELNLTVQRVVFSHIEVTDKSE